MSSRKLLQIKELELRRLLDEVGDDPILGPQFRDRLDEVERELAGVTEYDPAEELESLPRTAIFLRGEAVKGTVGIRSGLAGEALLRYEQMFMEQSLQAEREIARESGRTRRPRGSQTPTLLFVGTPRGSFGLEFVPQPTGDPDLFAVRKRALATVTTALSRIGSTDQMSFVQSIGEVYPSALRPMKLFLKALSSYGAELRLVHEDRATDYLSADQVTEAVALLEKEVIEMEVKVNGVFRGATLQSGYFDLRAEDDELITGSVSREIPEAELLKILDLTNKPCEATLWATTVRRVSGEQSTTYVLLDARPRT